MLRILLSLFTVLVFSFAQAKDLKNKPATKEDLKVFHSKDRKIIKEPIKLKKIKVKKSTK